MSRPLKFRYAGELAGGLVILAAVLAVTGVVLTGRTQGWFEGRFALHTTFDTPKGSFGLREGNEVIIMNALAGRVGKIEPTPQGHLSATFILKERFRQFVRKGSIAKVKKKFGVAGDSFVEIEIGALGSGDARVVSDGDYIPCLKDEEIMETAQKALKNVQGVALPMLKEIQDILHHANAILALLEKGEGTAGAVLHDEALAADVKGVISDVRSLLDETRGTFRETTRLVTAAKKHWLFRKHVEHEPADLWLTPATHRLEDPRAGVDRYRPALRHARAADNPSQIARNACNLAVCLIHSGDHAAAMPYVMEARSELVAAKANPAMTFMLEAEIMRLRKDTDAALATARHAADLFRDADDRDGHLEAGLAVAAAHCDAENGAEAIRALDDLRKALKKTTSARLRALALRTRGYAHLLAEDYAQAAASFDSGAALLREDASYAQMAECLAAGGRAHEAAGAPRAAADRYFRSARTLLALRNTTRGSVLLAKSRALANSLQDKDLQARLRAITTPATPDAKKP